MKHTIYDRIFKREIGHHNKNYTDARSIYGDRRWVDNLDIVNEIEGHDGCVNTLSWSTSGRLLASGSDDHRINIHSYEPNSSTSSFTLATSILTGHQSNIFSVRFMPHSNDRTILTAADDVRIFDLEHSGQSVLGSESSSNAGKRSVGIARDGVTLTEGDTNAKTFRCHTDTVRRIVTESSPFYFLTCSDDGDVRQWDVRQPSRAYPEATEPRVPRWAREDDDSDNTPAPLISYSRYGLGLNTISCSQSQPHYIALGGTHLHCFLHDRRMLGRDRNKERGSRLPSPAYWSEQDDELFGQATQCVKKFAPNGKKRMRRNDAGHITACKISDANPNELLVSWSQDHIYSFDILHTPDAREEIKTTRVSDGDSGRRVKDKMGKRKRLKFSTFSDESSERASLRQRTESFEDEIALRVRYNNGQTEEMRIEAPVQTGMSREELNELKSTDHYRIAKTTVMITKRMFDLAEHGETELKLAFTSILGFANSILSDMDEIARTWENPVDPDPVNVAVQKKLRDSRAASQRFVQAAGTLARVLGGELLTGASSDALISLHFSSIQPAPGEQELPQHEQFAYDFLKAILLWLDSGPSAVIEGFSSRSPSTRCPCPQDSDMDAIDDIIIPYLLDLASDKPIVNVDVSRFERNDTRLLYSTETAAVLAFAQAVKIPFDDLVGPAVPPPGNRSLAPDTQDRATAEFRWAFLIGRGVLRNAALDIKFEFVDRAFGGRGIADNNIRAEEQALRARQEDIDPMDHGDLVAEAELLESSRRGQDGMEMTSTSSDIAELLVYSEEDGHEKDEDYENTDEDDDDEDDDDEDDDDYEHDALEDTEEDDDYDDEDEVLHRTASGRLLWRVNFGPNRPNMEKVELEVPCAPHTRVYRGHCNVKTTKDVNYFGQLDEYVVSGSDCGHFFIWDRKTAQLVNILKGDDDVVNIVEANPHEPMMAVSGIDHTIKIFSPDNREQYKARKGVGVKSSSFDSSRRTDGQASTDDNEGGPADLPSDSDEEVSMLGLKSCKRMNLASQITSQNEMDRKGGRDDYFVSEAVYAQLALQMSADRAGGGSGAVRVTEENCSVM